MPSDTIISWEELTKQYPEAFKIVKTGGTFVLKIVYSELKEKYSELKEYIKSKKIGPGAQVLRSSEIQKYLTLKEINFDEKNKLVKKYMKTEDWPIYLLGRNALIEKQSYNMPEVMQIKNEAGQLAGRRGIMLINFILQGYFEEIFIPLLKHQIGELKSDGKVYSWFNEFLTQQIIFFPRAIWVTNEIPEKMIKTSLYKRCVANQFKEINIHTIGDSNVKKVENVLSEIGTDGEFPEFDFEKVEELKDSGAFTFKIKVKD